MVMMEQMMQMMVDRLGANPVCLHIPIGAEDNFKGVVDLVKMQAIEWDDESLGAAFHTRPIPDALQEQANQMREKLVEAAADADEAVVGARSGVGKRLDGCDGSEGCHLESGGVESHGMELGGDAVKWFSLILSRRAG